MTAFGGRRIAPPAPEPSGVGDAAWRQLGAAFREWAQAPTGEHYRAFLDADRRWREMAEDRGPGRAPEDEHVRRAVMMTR